MSGTLGVAGDWELVSEDDTFLARPGEVREAPGWLGSAGGLTQSAVQRALDELWNGPVGHPFEQIAGHFGDEPCICMWFPPTEPHVMILLEAGPVHPEVARTILTVHGAYRAHPLLTRWWLVELTVPGEPLAFPWPEKLPGLADHLRALAADRTGHDRELIAVSLPYRDCPRHASAPRGWEP